MRGHTLRSLLGAMLVALSVAGCAQPPKPIPRVGYMAAVSAAADAPRLEGFRQGLRDLGYIEGQSILIDYRHEARGFEPLPGIAAELLRLEPDVLVGVTTNAALAAKQSTVTVPIVFMGVTDPIGAGLAESFRRPGGNSTGITNMAATLTGKRIEYLKETMPELARLAVLWDPRAPGSTPQWEESQLAARDLGLELYSLEVSSVDDYGPAFEAAAEADVDAVWVTLNPLANSNQKLIADLAIAHRMHTVCAREDYAHNGCLMAYGPGYATEGRDAARYVDRILRGAKPSELPVEQPMRFELVVNLRTAQALDRTVPPHVLLQATQIVQ